MSSGNGRSPEQDYFDGISHQSNADGDNHRHSQERSNSDHGNNEDGVPRPKRIACVICRKRKLRCDGNKPSCGTCKRLGHDCTYDEVRRKSGPKRGYVKQLEARLAQVVTQVETLLKNQDSSDINAASSSTTYPDAAQSTLIQQTDFHNSNTGINIGISSQLADDMLHATDAYNNAMGTSPVPDPLGQAALDMGLSDPSTFSWEMMSQGLDEPLPTQDVIDELHDIYFEKIHPSVPMIHRRRYLAALNLAPSMRPPISLRYAMWCLAASVSEKYINLPAHFYARARKYAELDEMRGHGENIITIAHSQAWTLIATYEFKLMYFPRAWMSTGRGVRLAQMMGLHRLDGLGLDVKQCLPPPRDWTEREERRRTFWMAFCEDRYASIGTGWPMVIEEKDILTNLPSTEEAFDKSKPARTPSLTEAMNPQGAASLSSFAGVVLMACLFGRNLTHLHRPDPNDNDEDLNGEFWKRHRNMDNILLNTSLAMPGHLRLPAGINDANIVFLNMNIHTSTICLHQAAIFKADKNRLSGNVSAESKVRCITAAAEIASIMRMISHTDLSAMNPFLSFCLYVAARVFVQYIKSRPEDQQARATFQFLLTAMQALKRGNPLTESFLVQLDVDLEGTGLDDPNTNSKFGFSLKKGVAEVPIHNCSGILDWNGQQNNVPTWAESSNGSPRSVDHSETTYRPFFPYAPHDDVRQTLPNRQKPTVHGVQLQGVTLGRGTGDLYPNGDPQQNLYSDMDTSPDNRVDDLHHSTDTSHTSPSMGSNKGSSSHTSFTPPHMDDSQHSTSTSHHSGPPAFFASTPFAGLSPSQFLPPTPGKDRDSAYVYSQAWTTDHSGMAQQVTGMTPANTDMTPIGVGDNWTQMLEGMGWDGPGILGLGEEAHPILGGRERETN
ncbi:MAG: hypothetical protein M1827_006464 [Pycnora praestabilis]|nr:MAG: hypothetical protein M1827_006464 [Pycnora praestabilis]